MKKDRAKDQIKQAKREINEYGGKVFGEKIRGNQGKGEIAFGKIQTSFADLKEDFRKGQ